MPLLLLLVACREDAGDTAGDAGDATFTDVHAELSDVIETVVTVTFTTDAAGTGWVAFGPQGEEGWTATATDLGGGTWQATLLGLPEEAVGWYRVGAGDVSDSVTHEVETGDAPGWVDKLVSTDGEPEPGFLVMGYTGSDGGGAVILDTRGRPVWWVESPEGVPGNIHSRARLSPDGSAVWFNAFGLMAPGGAGDGENVLVRASIDGTEVEVVDLPLSHHDFVVMEDGSLVWLDVDERQVERETVRGDALMERAPDGAERVIWSSWDTYTFTPGETFTNPESWWTLANHLEYVPADDVLAVSSRNLDTITVIDRASGEVRDVVGADPAATVVPDDPFDGQHGFDVLDGELLVFDNGDPEVQSSRVARYTIAGATATLNWAYEPGLYSYVMGDAQVLPGGGVLMVVTTEATVHHVDPSGQRVAAFQYEAGTMLGFAEHHPALVR